jgi:hypothetical protein
MSARAVGQLASRITTNEGAQRSFFALSQVFLREWLASGNRQLRRMSSAGTCIESVVVAISPEKSTATVVGLHRKHQG